MALKIREMMAQDVTSVYELGREAFDVRNMLYHQYWCLDEILKHLRRDGIFCLVAEVGGKIVGFALGHRRYSPWQRGVGHFEWIAVRGDHRGTGVGTALCEEMLRRFRAARAKRVLVDIKSENTPSVKLFEHFGFRKAFSVDWLMKEL